MNPEKLESHLAGFKGAEGGLPFGPEALVYKVMGKMFALVSQNEAVPRLTVKCRPGDGELLTGQFEAIVPGYHMNKRHWITIHLNGELPDEMIRELARNSYDLVAGRLTKAEKSALAAQ